MKKLHTFTGLLKGKLIKRYKRFLFDAKLETGELITGLCPNTGSMKGMNRPGSAILVSHHPEEHRKTKYTLQMVKADGVWVGVNTHLTNSLAEAILRKKLAGRELASLADEIKREKKVGDSRLDFHLSGGGREAYAEVKNVTLMEGNRALFPDAVTARGRKHLLELVRLADKGYGAYIIFVVQRGDCRSFSPAEDIDPDYARTLKEVSARGVKPLAFLLRLRRSGVFFEKRLPVRL